MADQFELLHSRFLAGRRGGVVVADRPRVFFTHRIAGPLYRFRRIFQSVANGDLTVRTSIRKRLSACRSPGVWEKMVSALREKIGRIGRTMPIWPRSWNGLKAAAARGALRSGAGG